MSIERLQPHLTPFELFAEAFPNDFVGRDVCVPTKVTPCDMVRRLRHFGDMRYLRSDVHLPDWRFLHQVELEPYDGMPSGRHTLLHAGQVSLVPWWIVLGSGRNQKRLLLPSTTHAALLHPRARKRLGLVVISIPNSAMGVSSA